MSQSKSEHESWMSLSFEDSKEHNYNHLIVIRAALRGFQSNSSSSSEMNTDASTSMRDRSHKFLDELNKYPRTTLITFEGRTHQQSFDFNSLMQSSSLEKEYKKIKRIFLANGLSNKSYRLFTVFDADVEQQVTHMT